METIFNNKKISAMLGVLPEREIHFEEEVGNYSFPEKQTLRLKRVMGYEKHRLAKCESTAADFAVYGMRYILDNNWISKEEIGGIVVVTLCPDFFVPHISNIVQAEVDLDMDVVCMDIAQGCCGFLLGLFQSFMLLEHFKGKKVVLINADVLSHKISRRDRNDFPLIGDGAAITIVENSDDCRKIYYEMHIDGKQRDALIIPAGGFKQPCNENTSIMQDMGNGNFRSLENMHMDGNAVFNFVQKKVPPLIEGILEKTGNSIDDIDYFLFHQPNVFMLEKLAQKIGIPFLKMPMNLVKKCGNPSGASIPLVTLLNLSKEMKEEEYNCCLSAFGSGLAWGAMVMKWGKMDYCDLIVSDL